MGYGQKTARVEIWVLIRVGIIIFFKKPFVTERTEQISNRGNGDRDFAFAPVAEEYPTAGMAEHVEFRPEDMTESAKFERDLERKEKNKEVGVVKKSSTSHGPDILFLTVCILILLLLKMCWMIVRLIQILTKPKRSIGLVHYTRFNIVLPLTQSEVEIEKRSLQDEFILQYKFQPMA